MPTINFPVTHKRLVIPAVASAMSHCTLQSCNCQTGPMQKCMLQMSSDIFHLECIHLTLIISFDKSRIVAATSGTRTSDCIASITSVDFWREPATLKVAAQRSKYWYQNLQRRQKFNTVLNFRTHYNHTHLLFANNMRNLYRYSFIHSLS